MALHFHKLTVKDIRNETDDCVSVAFDVPVHLQNEFIFKHGQNVTIKFAFKGEEIRRSYSICNSPLDNELRVAIKKVPNGAFSSFANQKLKKGDVLEILPPSGSFSTPLNPSFKKDYVFFAAGSGITPIISIIKTILLTELKSTVTLLYGNKTVTSIIFKEQLQALKDKYLQRFSLYHILSRETTETDINFGRIDAEKCQQFSKLINYSSVDEFFICGPEQMIFTVKDFLEGTGIEKNKIHFELFTTPERKSTKHEVKEQGKKEGNNISVKLDGRSFDFILDYNGTSILDAALEQGADLPFACKGGVCTTCKARLLKGEVEMDVNYGLEQEEIEAGFILTCQSHPKSKNVVIDFDTKS